MKTVIIDYNAGNIQSVKFALERIGANPILSNNIEEIQKADKVKRYHRGNVCRWC